MERLDRLMLSVLLMICSVGSCVMIMPKVYSTDSVSLDLYRAVAQVSTTSEWSKVYLTDGAIMVNWKSQILSGSQDPALHVSSPNPGTGLLLGITKVSGDMTNVTIEVTLVVRSIQAGHPISFLIQKGAVGVTAIQLYNFNTNDRRIIRTFQDNIVGSIDGLNSASISVAPESLADGGPLADPFQGPSHLVWANYYTLYSDARSGWADRRFKDRLLFDSSGMTDKQMILRDIRIAKSAGIDGFIVAWWFNPIKGSLLSELLDVASGENFKIAMCFPAVNGTGMTPITEQNAAGMLGAFLSDFEHDVRYFMINGKPVVFVYAVDTVSLSFWHDVLGTLRSQGHDAFYIGETEQGRADLLQLFDGIYVYSPLYWYSTLGLLYQNLELSTRSYGFLHPETPAKLWIATLIPGFDDSLLNRQTIHYLARNNGSTYRQTFDAALKSNPDWIMITSFNEWYENSQIECSVSYGWQYGNLTMQFSTNFKQGSNPLTPQIRPPTGPPTASLGLSTQQKIILSRVEDLLSFTLACQ